MLTRESILTTFHNICIYTFILGNNLIFNSLSNLLVRMSINLSLSVKI